MRTGHIFNIMVGSPSDVIDIARKAIEVINLWNVHHSEDKGIVLVPHHWSSSSYPSLKVNSAQGVINSQLVDKCDALVQNSELLQRIIPVEPPKKSQKLEKRGKRL